MAAGHKVVRFVRENYSPVVYIGAEESKSVICVRKQTIVTKALSAAVEVPASPGVSGLIHTRAKTWEKFWTKPR